MPVPVLLQTWLPEFWGIGCAFPSRPGTGHDHVTAMANPGDQPNGPVFEQICQHIEQTGIDKVKVLVRQGVYGQAGKIMAFWPKLTTEPWP